MNLLEQKAVPGRERIRQDIEQNSEYMLSNILDSVDEVEFFLLLEETCKISVPDEDQEFLETFDQVFQYVDDAACQ